MVESEKAARQRKEDMEAKRRAREGRRTGASSGREGSRNGASSSREGRRSSSRRSSERSRRNDDQDREAKRRARRSSGGGGEEVKPGVSYEKSPRSSSRRPNRDEEDRAAKQRARGLGGSSRSVGRSQRSNRDDEDRAAKNRARRSVGSGSNRPGVSSVSAGDGMENKIRRKQSRNDAKRSSSGRKPSSGRSVEGQRPGASSSRGADHRKNRNHGRSSSGRSNSGNPVEPVAKAADGEDNVAVEAMAIDEEAQENERVRALEEQNRALADRMDQIANREKEAEAARRAAAEEEEARKRRQKQKMRRIACIVTFLLVVGGGVAAYFLTLKTDAPVETPASPLDEDTAAPMVPPVNGTQPPAAPDISEGPPSSPAIDAFNPPTSDDCAQIRSGEVIEGQEKLNTSPFLLAFDVTINDPNLSTDDWVQSFKDGIDQVLIPALAGCPINRRLESIDQESRNVTSTTSLEQAFPRELLEVQSDIRYVIANGNSSIDPSQDVTDDCEIKAEGCNNVKVPLNLFLKGLVRGFELETLIDQVIQYLVDLESSGNRQLESKNGEQPHHRKLLVNILRLDLGVFKNVKYRGKGNVDPPPLEEPTLGPIVAPTTPVNEPTGAPTPTPSETPSWVPSDLPSSRPTMAPVSGPTPPPTKAPTKTPTQAPTPLPTKTPTQAPTFAPVAGPTPSPTKAPTPPPTPPPTSQPTVQASGTPTQFPSTVPSSAPTVQASGTPSQFPSTVPSSAPTTKRSVLESILSRLAPFDGNKESALDWLAGDTWMPPPGDSASLWEERFVLALLYYTTSGNGWSNNDGWLTSSDVCSGWAGVGCNGDGSVNSLNLIGGVLLNYNPYNLAGDYPDELRYLSNLEVFNNDFNGVALSGSIPSFLFALTKLTFLGMSDTGRTGTIPSELWKMSMLESIYLKGNFLSGPISSGISTLTALRFLDLAHNDLTGSIPNEISALSLEIFDAHENFLSGSIPPLQGNPFSCSLASEDPQTKKYSPLLHYQTRKSEGNCFSDTSNVISKCTLSANLADSSCTGGDKVCESTSTSVTNGLCGSCIGTWACRGFRGSIGRNSCTGDGSCRHTYNTVVNIGDNSCNGGSAQAGGSALSHVGGANACRNLRSVTIGDNSCNCKGCCACLADGSTIGDNECNNPGDCCSSVGGPLNVGSGSCTNGDYNSCIGAKGPIGAGSCLTTRSCQSSRAQIGDGSCTGLNSCYDFNTYDLWNAPLQTGAIGDNSCLGEASCSKMTGGVGNNSCQGRFACSLRVRTYVGNNSCQCERCCQCLEAESVIEDNQCNTPGECCKADGSPL